MEHSIRFQQLPGFTAVDTDRCDPLGWARMHGEGEALIFLLIRPPRDSCSTRTSRTWPQRVNGCRPTMSQSPRGAIPKITLKAPDGATIFVAPSGASPGSRREECIGHTS
jgi:hypothetical protein